MCCNLHFYDFYEQLNFIGAFENFFQGVFQKNWCINDNKRTVHILKKRLTVICTGISLFLYVDNIQNWFHIGKYMCTTQHTENIPRGT